MQRCQSSSITVIFLSPFLSLSLSIYAYTIFLHLQSPNTPSSSITVEYVSLFILWQDTKQNLLMLHSPIGLEASLNCNSDQIVNVNLLRFFAVNAPSHVSAELRTFKCLVWAVCQSFGPVWHLLRNHGEIQLTLYSVMLPHSLICKVHGNHDSSA